MYELLAKPKDAGSKMWRHSQEQHVLAVKTATERADLLTRNQIKEILKHAEKLENQSEHKENLATNPVAK